MHIGIIGGIGPAATEFYYRNLVSRASDINSGEFDLTIVHAEISELIDNLRSNSPDVQAMIYLELTNRLKAAGADMVAIASVAGHFCEKEFSGISTLPVVSLIGEIEAALAKQGLKKVGVLGNKATMVSKLFGGVNSSEIVVPKGKNLDIANDLYMDMATQGKVGVRQRETLFDIGSELCSEQGAEAVVLAGTDLFLAFDGHDCGYEVIDSALVHINALIGQEFLAAIDNSTQADQKSRS